MKKRNIVIISLSVISLVFGGLVFLGVSTFPELLEEEKKQIETSHKEDVLFNAPSNENNKNEETTASAAASSGSSKYVINSSKTFKSSTRSDFADAHESVHHVDDVSFAAKEQSTPNKEVTSGTISEVKTPSTYYKGKSYVSIKKEREAMNLPIKTELDRSEVIKNRNKNIVNTIVLVVVAIEALAFIFLNKKRHSHQA